MTFTRLRWIKLGWLALLAIFFFVFSASWSFDMSAPTSPLCSLAKKLVLSSEPSASKARAIVPTIWKPWFRMMTAKNSTP